MYQNLLKSITCVKNEFNQKFLVFFLRNFSMTRLFSQTKVKEWVNFVCDVIVNFLSCMNLYCSGLQAIDLTQRYVTKQQRQAHIAVEGGRLFTIFSFRTYLFQLKLFY